MQSDDISPQESNSNEADMKPFDNLSLIFNAVPEGIPEPGQHLTVEKRPISKNDVHDGSLLARMIYSSLDPYMRMMLIPPGQKHYRKPFELGKPLTSYGVAEVICSRQARYDKGQIIRGVLPISEYAIIADEDMEDRRITGIDNENLPLNVWLGPLGMPGETAYCSLFEIGRPREGQTIFVSAASGAVGQLVGQICKNLDMKVIGSVGSKEKLEDIKKLGFDDGFVYREEDPDNALARLAPNGIDIYYDNVGGVQLEAALNHIKKYSRIVVSGMISQYNLPPDQRYGVKNLFQLVSKSATMKGFQVGDIDIRHKWTESHQKDMTKWLEAGTIKPTFDETVGIEHGAEAFKAMLAGGNRGKVILKLWPDFDDSVSAWKDRRDRAATESSRNSKK